MPTTLTILLWLTILLILAPLTVDLIKQRKQQVARTIALLWLGVVGGGLLLTMAAIFILRQAEKEAVAPQRITELIEQLGHSREMVRQNGANSLAQVGQPAIEPIVAAYRASGDPTVQKGLLDALRWMRDPQAVAGLTGLLDDPRPEIAAAAATALGNLMDPSSSGALIEALQGGDPNLRVAAAAALGNLKDPTSIEALIEALQGNDPNLRAAAAGALSGLWAPGAEAALEARLALQDLAVIAALPEFYLPRGRPGDENLFIQALYRYGGVKTANTYLNCGNPALSQAAADWGRANGYDLVPSARPSVIPWGGK